MAGGPAAAMPAQGVDAGSGAKVAAGRGPSRPGADAAATPTPASDAAANGSTAAATAPVNTAVKRDAAAGDPGRSDDTPSDFAALLATTGNGAAITTAAVAAPAPAAAESDATEPAATTALPDQFLALLSGSWALPAPAAAATVATPASAGNAPALPMPPMPSPPADGAAAGLPLAAAPPAPARAASSTPRDAFAALGALAAGAPGAASEAADNDLGAGTADASPSPDSFALTTVAPSAAAARAGALPPTAPLALPADPEAGFDDGFGARIAWMAEQRLGHAQIRLNPEHVGPIDVRVQLDGDRVSTEFHSAHAEVRQAIEASLPRLREMLGQHGLQLGQADVGHGQSGRRGDQMLSHDRGPARGDELDPRLTAVPIRSTRGLLDEYA